MMSRRGWLVVVIGVLVGSAAGCTTEPMHKTLHGAVQAGDAENVRMQLRPGADVNAADNEGRTPLAVPEAGEMADLLRQHGAKE